MKKTTAQGPETFQKIKLIPIPKSAAGIKAIQSSLAHIQKETGLAKGIKLLANINQTDGFDCPGCAWPDPDDKRAFLAEYCENGAKAIAEEATNKRVTPMFFTNYSVEELSKLSDYEIGKKGRITHPVIKRENSSYYQEISWEEAYNEIAKELHQLEHPNEAIFYTSGRTSNEAAYLYQLMVRKYGTNNLPDCSNMCHESSGAALSETLGIGKGSVTLEDFNHAELVIVIGQNPGTNHPRMLSALEDTKKHGGQIMTINPLPEVGLMAFKNPQKPTAWVKEKQLTDLYIPVPINGDVSLLKAIMLLLLEKEDKNPGKVLDLEFIEKDTHGYEVFIEDIKKYDIDTLIAQTGLSKELVYDAADCIASKKRIIICWAMGLTQHKNGVDNIREVVNLLLLKGAIGKKGAGTCPVRGHSNVQGDRTMGIWEKPKETFLNALDSHFQIKTPREHGYDVLEAIEAMHAGKAKVFFAMGGNFLSASPDTEYTAEALQKCHLTVQVSTKLNRSHLITGKKAIILPCLGRSEKDIQQSGEQFVSVENSMGVVHMSKGVLPQLSKHLKSEPAIVAELAKALFPEDTIDWMGFKNNYDTIRDAIEHTIPGFKEYNKRVLVKGGFYLPNNARDKNFSPTKTQKANFTINRCSEIVLEKEQLLMMTVRTHDQYNTTIYGLNDRYRGVLNERRVLFMNDSDMEERNLKTLDIIDIYSHFEGEVRKVANFYAIAYPIPKNCTASYFPETNPLVALKNKADISNTPASKAIIITVTKRNS